MLGLVPAKLWAGTVLVQPNAKTFPHHHGELETVLYVVRGRARMRWGDQLECSAEAGRATSFMSRLSSPTRRSTPFPINYAKLPWFASDRSRSWQISTSKRPRMPAKAG
jgi:hypothetical protein